MPRSDKGRIFIVGDRQSWVVYKLPYAGTLVWTHCIRLLREIIQINRESVSQMQRQASSPRQVETLNEI